MTSFEKQAHYWAHMLGEAFCKDGLLDAKKKGKDTLFSLTSKGEDLLRSCGAI